MNTQLSLFNNPVKFSPNRDELGRFCTPEEYRNRETRYWKDKAEMYERAYFALTKRLITIERNELNHEQKISLHR